ncbi:hypothetical protein K2F43_06010 [Clostridium estertheticum]|uniref:hypothetical protein n=1 Tax=Clostridium estertheticum TaxID=238834 RepID=UPI001C6DEDBE|nr:hypothetical protein [Clostridium estertheticum]MBW9170760.1 hypothetical protein [Clostridium estertheticum]
MVNVVCIPFSSNKEKWEITQEIRNKGQKYKILDGGFIYTEEYIGHDEIRTGKLIWEYKQQSN